MRAIAGSIVALLAIGACLATPCGFVKDKQMVAA
jgi:hypothetical protein